MKRLRRALLIAVTIAATACASHSSSTPRHTMTPHTLEPQRFEIDDFPFVEQQSNDCAAAALSMLFTYYGLPTELSTQRARTLSPDAEGSFQFDIVSASRREGFITTELHPTLETIISEVQTGTPVLVLLDVGVSLFRSYHYALVIGYDLPNEQLLLTSGRKQREVFSFTGFNTTWSRADAWAVAITPAGTIPKTASLESYIRNAAALEDMGLIDKASAAYHAAVERWKGHALAHFALGNLKLSAGDYAGAVEEYTFMDSQHISSASMLNNYAWALAHIGDSEKAAEIICRAFSLNTNECGHACHNTYHFINESLHAQGKLAEGTRLRCPRINSPEA